jgi:hypothetical protein
MPSVTNALEELVASIFRTDYANGRFLHNVGNYLSDYLQYGCHISDDGDKNSMSCKLASVSDAQVFDSEETLLNYYASLNGTGPHTCAVIFDLPQDGDVDDLRYKIRISNTWFYTAQLFPDFSTWVGYKGKADSICNKYIIQLSQLNMAHTL